MVIFAGTTNSDDCLPNDSSGNRRFVVVELPHGCDVAAASVDRAQWWAEAWTRYHAGERANLPRDLHAEAAERVEAHREVDALEADIRDALHDLPEDGFTIADLYYLLPGNAGAKPADRAMQMRLANGLKNLGFTSHQRLRGGMRARAWSR